MASMAYKPRPKDKPIAPEALARALEIRNAGTEDEVRAALMVVIGDLVAAIRGKSIERESFLSQILAGYVVTQPKKMSASKYNLFMLAIGHSLDRENP
jgi:hypothetical protein